MRKPCPKQKRNQCVIKTNEFRQCGCKLNPGLKNIGNSRCEGDMYIRDVTDCPLVPYGECKCIWMQGISTHCEVGRKTCDSSVTSVTAPRCACKPSWHEGACEETTKPQLLLEQTCPPTLQYEWEEWESWSDCDVFTCKRKRYRKCGCQDDTGVHLESNCDGEAFQTETCPTVWGPWEGGCTSEEPTCAASLAIARRSCCCQANRGIQWEGSEAQDKCGYLGGSATREEECAAKPYDVTSWGEWSGCDNTCNQRQDRDCACTDETNRQDLDRSKCANGTSYQMEKTCSKGWSEWSNPDCGDITCVMKTRPRFRMCLCENGLMLDNRECGKLFEIAVKCPFIPPDDPKCINCICSEWECDEECDNTYTRKCGPTPGCDIEARFTKDNCCLDKPPCTCTEWECKESCDATMIRTCENKCDIEEKPIAQPCCSVEPVCTCTDWQCADTCDGTMIRNCAEGCEREEEKEIGQLCCDADRCECSEWRCTESCDATMIRDCTPGCDIMEEKPIAQLCCGVREGGDNKEEEKEETWGDEEEEEDCNCGKWVGVSCVLDESGCVQEEWRVCSPNYCQEQVRNVTSTCCDNDQSVIPEDCSACGRWIDIGKCRDDKNGTHQWRSTRVCDKNSCEEFRCVPDGKHCKEEKCGQWYDIGICDLQPDQGNGIHQWRDTEECFCEPYRCRPTSPEAPDDLKLCECTGWQDISGCDVDCINTVSRSCNPPACAEEWRIQSGFCCN
ncbi:A disintegrin and metalloproteinase with thrombospondin motifs adt-1-like isoform X2 [Bolinopsis microptera]